MRLVVKTVGISPISKNKRSNAEQSSGVYNNRKNTSAAQAGTGVYSATTIDKTPRYVTWEMVVLLYSCRETSGDDIDRHVTRSIKSEFVPYWTFC